MDMNGPGNLCLPYLPLAPSMYDVNTIWAGSEWWESPYYSRWRQKLGRYQRLRTLRKISSRISIIDEGKSSLETLLSAANRYQVDESTIPTYLRRRIMESLGTKNHHRNWKKVICRAFVKDLQKPGLLYPMHRAMAYMFLSNVGKMWQINLQT